MPHRYSNLDPCHRPHSASAVWRWAVTDRLLGRRRRRPPGPAAPCVAADLELIHEDSKRPRLTWIGHSGFVGTLDGASFLVDPVFSSRIGGVYRRYCPPGLQEADLPQLHVVLVTHNHYDHLDAATIDGLSPSVPAVVPEGLGEWMRRRGRAVVELSWWQSTRVGPLDITLVPGRHWSRRRINDTNCSRWGGYVVRAGDRAVYHAGDTAWFPGFSEIGRRLGPLTAAMLPIGGYDPAWFMERQHLNPEQAGQAWLELGAACMVPMHWGTFRLTDEPLSEPRARLLEWWARGVDADHGGLADLAVGETVILGGARDR
jgi:L-ascorbate metabolism protein UlaG (beta-lactamase superfamily)